MAQAGIVAARVTNSISTSRRVKDKLFWGCCCIALLFVLTPVIWISWGVLAKALPHFDWTVISKPTAGIGGGLLDAIAGTFSIMVGVGIVISIIGIGGGIYLSEVAVPGKPTTILRSAAEVLSGIPSIVFGYCGFLALVSGLHWKYGLLPAVIVVSMLVVPYVIKATELALGQVPLAYREGAEALGMSRIYILRKIILRAGLPGILTGIIIALAIAVGETAPLLFTAGNSTQYPNLHLINHPIGYLTYAVYTYLDEPVKSLQILSYEAAFLLMVLVFALILSARLAVRLTQKYAPNRAQSSGGFAERRAIRANRQGTATTKS